MNDTIEVWIEKRIGFNRKLLSSTRNVCFNLFMSTENEHKHQREVAYDDLVFDLCICSAS